MYGYKVFVLLCAPEKNTKAYFNMAIRKKVAQQQQITLNPVPSRAEEQVTELWASLEGESVIEKLF